MAKQFRKQWVHRRSELPIYDLDGSTYDEAITVLKAAFENTRNKYPDATDLRLSYDQEDYEESYQYYINFKTKETDEEFNKRKLREQTKEEREFTQYKELHKKYKNYKK